MNLEGKQDPLSFEYSEVTSIFKFHEIMEIEELRAKLVTIGPYHRHETLEFRDVDKWRIVDLIISSFGLDITTFFKSMARIEKEIRACCIDGWFQMNNTEIFERMLLDGCFIIFALKCFKCDPFEIGELLARKSQNQKDAYRNMTDACNLTESLKSHKECLIYDFLLMDNQIPFFILNELLIICPRLNAFIGCKIEDLALSCFKKVSPKMDKDKTKPRIEFLHLLDLFHWSRVPTDKYKMDDLPVPVKYSVPYFYGPRVVNLHKIGLKFKKRTSGCSSEILIKESSCKKYNVIKIPKFDIDKFNFYLLESLSTFELRYKKRGFCFTGFIECMTSLLRSESDAELLKKSGIIPTKARASNDFVVRFFRDLSRRVEPIVVMPYPYEKYLSVIDDRCKKQKKDRPKSFSFSFNIC